MTYRTHTTSSDWALPRSHRQRTARQGSAAHTHRSETAVTASAISRERCRPRPQLPHRFNALKYAQRQARNRRGRHRPAHVHERRWSTRDRALLGTGHSARQQLTPSLRCHHPQTVHQRPSYRSEGQRKKAKASPAGNGEKDEKRHVTNHFVDGFFPFRAPALQRSRRRARHA